MADRPDEDFAFKPLCDGTSVDKRFRQSRAGYLVTKTGMQARKDKIAANENNEGHFTWR